MSMNLKSPHDTSPDNKGDITHDPAEIVSNIKRLIKPLYNISLCKNKGNRIINVDLQLPFVT